MAIDTHEKRSSCLHVGLPWMLGLPRPDGTIDDEDRVQTAFSYRLEIDEDAIDTDPIAIVVKAESRQILVRPTG